jgi:hypothetical protein
VLDIFLGPAEAGHYDDTYSVRLKPDTTTTAT